MRLTSLALATAAFFTSAAVLLAEPVRYTPDQLFTAGNVALSSGQPQTALEVADALIARKADSSRAHTLRSQALRDLQEAKASIKAARTALKTASSQEERFWASLAMAQALSTDGQRTRAQLWLRRASQSAPDERLKKLVARDYRYVRSRNNWRTWLSFNIAPSSNINNGSVKSTSQLFDMPLDFTLSPDARALSGTELSFGISAQYRLADAPTHKSFLSFQAHHRSYRLSDEARRIAPKADASDYAYTYGSIGYTSAHKLNGWKLPLQWEAKLGQQWYGGDPHGRFLRLGVTQGVPVGRKARVDFSLDREWQIGLNGREDAQVWTGELALTTKMQKDNRLRLSLEGTRSHSDDSNQDFSRYALGARYTLGQPVAGLGLEFGLSAAKRDFDRNRYTRKGRHDTELSANMTAVINQVEVYGFSPTVTFSASKRDSNIGLYDSEEFGIQIGIRSAF